MAKAIPSKTAKIKTSKAITKSAAVTKSSRVSFRSDAKQAATLVKVGRAGAANAIRASKALGLPIIYLQKGVLIKEYADGTKEIIIAAAVKKSPIKKASYPLKKGMVFHAKK